MYKKYFTIKNRKKNNESKARKYFTFTNKTLFYE